MSFLSRKSCIYCLVIYCTKDRVLLNSRLEGVYSVALSNTARHGSTIGFHLLRHSHEYSSLFIIVINLIFMFSL